MKYLLPSVLAVLALASTSTAQKLSVQFTEPFFSPDLLELKISDTTGNGFNMASPCGDIAIFLSTQNGPPIPGVPTCGPGFTPISAYGTFTFNWPAIDPGGNLWPESDYWFRIRVQDPLTGAQIEEWFCHRWKNSGAYLGLGGDAQVGQSTPLFIGNAPANSFYWIVAARSQNTPFALFGQNFCISADAVFFSSINNPAGLMSNSFGVTDATGSVSAALNVPNIPSLLYQNVVLQSVTIDIAGSGAYGTTNPRSFRIVP
jgi:hypothetical protein